ncbi:MAG: hypothetical protein WAT70_14780 [Rhizobiaceae bacterium]
MKRLAIIAAFTLSVEVAMAQSVAGVDIQRMAGQSRAAAEAARAVLAELVTDANAARMGLRFAAAATRASIGPPFADFMVDLPRLAGFRAGIDPATLLRPTGMIVYPLATERGGLSSVTLADRDGKWQAVSFGSPARTRAMEETRAETARRDQARLEDYFQVRIAPFNVIFVARVGGGQLWLTPAFSNPVYKLQKGKSLPAATMFSGLAEFAKTDPGGFR